MKTERAKAVTFLLIFSLMLGAALRLTHPGETESVFAPVGSHAETVVIDAGHGGEDGGAVSVSGAVESGINLEIALKLDQIFGLFGVDTLLLRDSDISLHDSTAQTLREKKASDLRNRAAAVNALDDPILISIHQNTYTSGQYHGAQVFYADNAASLPLAQITQSTLKDALDPANHRQAAVISDDVYLMNHISCAAILVECGFLSNEGEDVLLQTPEYQTKIAAALAGAYLNYHQLQQEGESPDAS